MADFLAVDGIVKRFGAFTALAGIDLKVTEGEFLCLLGPSGCGKTTLLRIIAGLETQDRGRVLLAGRDISHLPPAQRDYGIVFQNYALFPNLNVAENIGYGLTDRPGHAPAAGRRTPGAGGAERRASAKYPSQLSGGQQQRVALARALATSPEAAAAGRAPVRPGRPGPGPPAPGAQSSCSRRLGITTIMVTHDQEEALSLADTRGGDGPRHASSRSAPPSRSTTTPATPVRRRFRRPAPTVPPVTVLMDGKVVLARGRRSWCRAAIRPDRHGCSAAPRTCASAASRSPTC